MSPFVEMQRIVSGKCSLTSRRASKVCSFASGSPGPAIPITLMNSCLASTSSIMATDSSGVTIRLVTPGRDSLTQS